MCSIIYYGNINKDTISLIYSSSLYCDPPLLHTHTLLISCRFCHGSATSSLHLVVIASGQARMVECDRYREVVDLWRWSFREVLLHMYIVMHVRSLLCHH